MGGTVSVLSKHTAQAFNHLALEEAMVKAEIRMTEFTSHHVPE